MTAVLVAVGLLAPIALLAVTVAAAARHRREVARPVEGEREIAILPVDRVWQVQRASHGSISPALAGITRARVTSRRLILGGASAPSCVVNLEPPPPGETAPLPPPDRHGVVVVARRDALEADFDRVNLDVRGFDGRYEIVRLLIHLPEGRRLERLIRDPDAPEPALGGALG